MATKTITAEIDGKVREITADVPDNYTQAELEDAVRAHLAQNPTHPATDEANKALAGTGLSVPNPRQPPKPYGLASPEVQKGRQADPRTIPRGDVVPYEGPGSQGTEDIMHGTERVANASGPKDIMGGAAQTGMGALTAAAPPTGISPRTVQGVVQGAKAMATDPRARAAADILIHPKTTAAKGLAGGIRTIINTVRGKGAEPAADTPPPVEPAWSNQIPMPPKTGPNLTVRPSAGPSPSPNAPRSSLPTGEYTGTMGDSDVMPEMPPPQPSGVVPNRAPGYAQPAGPPPPPAPSGVVPNRVPGYPQPPQPQAMGPTPSTQRVPGPAPMPEVPTPPAPAPRGQVPQRMTRVAPQGNFTGTIPGVVQPQPMPEVPTPPSVPPTAAPAPAAAAPAQVQTPRPPAEPPGMSDAQMRGHAIHMANRDALAKRFIDSIRGQGRDLADLDKLSEGTKKAIWDRLNEDSAGTNPEWKKWASEPLPGPAPIKPPEEPFKFAEGGVVTREVGPPLAGGGVVSPGDKYDTKLNPQEEARFQQWKKVNAPHDSGVDYDLRGAFKGGANPAQNGHFPDTWKKPNHPTFSVESQYHGVDGNQGGQWGKEGNRDTYTPSSTNLEHYPQDQLGRYFQQYEPDAILKPTRTPPILEKEPPARGAMVTPMAKGGVVVPTDAASGEDIIRGTSNIPLSPAGLAQAKELGGRFKAKGGVDHIDSSHLKRAVQTAHAINKATGAPVKNETDKLSPWHLGEIEGQPTKSVLDRIHKYVQKQPNVKVPGQGPQSTAPGESFNNFKRRLLGHLKEKLGELKKDPSKKIAQVTHYRDVRLAQAWAAKGFPDSMEINPRFMTEKGSDPPGTVLRLYWKGNKPALTKINMASNDKLPGGIYLVRHGVTAWNAENKGEKK